MHVADEIFRTKLDKSSINYTYNSDGLYEVQTNEGLLKVSLDNIRRNYDRDNDIDAINRFVEIQILLFSYNSPVWNDVTPFIRFSIQPNDYADGFEGVLTNIINEDLYQVFVYTNQDGTTITWINDSTLEKWGVTKEQVVQQAMQICLFY